MQIAALAESFSWAITELLKLPMIFMMVLQAKKHRTYEVWNIYPNFQVLLGEILTF